VPALRIGAEDERNADAECYLVDDENLLDLRSLLYIPVVHTEKILPGDCEKKRDFIYLAISKPAKRHDIAINAVRGTSISGHFHPVDGSLMDLSETKITTSNLNERSVVELLQTSRIAIYPGDHTSSPAAMWECVAAGLPIVVNDKIQGGKHLVQPGITGEFADENNFRDVMLHVLNHLDSYTPRKYFEDHWDTIGVLETYLSFFEKMGWTHPHRKGMAV
jgi:glycosyltransferase involved in cell wall biosynthesis